MVTAYRRIPQLIKRSGKILDLLSLRAIQDECLYYQPIHQKEQYCAVVAVAPVNFALLSPQEQEVVLEGFRYFVQRLLIHDIVSIHIRSSRYDLAEYQEILKDANRDAPEELQALAREHEAFVLTLAAERAILKRGFYVRLTAHLTAHQIPRRRSGKIERFDHAKNTLQIKCGGILEDLGRAGLSGSRLEDHELAAYLAGCVHSHAADSHPIQVANLLATGSPLRPIRLSDVLDGKAYYPTLIKDEEDTDKQPAIKGSVISKEQGQRELQFPQQRRFSWPWSWGKRKRKSAVPQSHVSLAELLEPEMISQTPHYIDIYKSNIHEYMRTRAIIGYPAFVIAGWLDRIIQINEPYIDILLCIENLDPTDYSTRLSRRLTGLKATLALDERHGRTENPRIKEAHDDTEILRQKIVQQIEKVHVVALDISMRATTLPELRARDERLVSLLRSLDLESQELTCEHLAAWMTLCEPWHDVIKRRKILDTSSLVTAFPFSANHVSTEPGALYGVTPSGDLVIVNPASFSLTNGHMVTLATSGAGKSYTEKLQVSRLLLMGYSAILIDPENEYTALTNKHGGTLVRLATGHFQLNPFDLPLTESDPDRNVLEEKMQSLLTLFDLLLAERGQNLTQREKAFLTKCLWWTYASKGITTARATHDRACPNMEEFYETIEKEKCGPDTFDLASRLARYVGSFPTTSTMALADRLICFNIRDLDEALKPVGLYLVTDFVWTMVRREKHPCPRLLVIDEAWTLLQFEEGGRFLSGLSRRARKYNLHLRTITQNAEDFLNSEHGRSILANAAMKLLMRQSGEVINLIEKTFRLSQQERQFLLTCAKGEGLFFIENSHVPLRMVSSAREHAWATSNPQELLVQEQERNDLDDETTFRMPQKDIKKE